MPVIQIPLKNTSHHALAAMIRTMLAFYPPRSEYSSFWFHFFPINWNGTLKKGKIIRNRDDIAGIEFFASCDCLIRKTVKRLKYFRNMIAFLQGTNRCEINLPRQVVVVPLFLTSSMCHKKKKIPEIFLVLYDFRAGSFHYRCLHRCTLQTLSRPCTNFLVSFSILLIEFPIWIGGFQFH